MFYADPGLASWAKFRRPCGTNFGNCEVWDTTAPHRELSLHRRAGFGAPARSRLKEATMPKFPLIVASITALLTFAASGPASAQSQANSSQSVPDAPQPQKKPATKPPSNAESPPADKTDSDKPNTQQPTVDSSAPTDKPAQKPPSTKDANPFPEDVSKQAAKEAAGSPSDSDHPADSAPGNPKPSTAADNPFPESVSRDAAKAAGNDPAPAAKPDIPPGYSSSQSNPGPDQVADPARAKKDAEVGGFYLKSGDYQGALLRYKDATTADPTNVEAIFGLAETQRMLKNNPEAARNYQLYLEIVPNGPKSKQALKALKALGSGG
jgi:Tetratricopeptide repeat